ncbi:hypothetical protein BR93DRAFT_176983 [Coniochaeta sp. PMI_546]|nr:hypothetical protein BR93DRAFT_176983 [Coniochaeta sp. PMI_546]
MRISALLLQFLAVSVTEAGPLWRDTKQRFYRYPYTLPNPAPTTADKLRQRQFLATGSPSSATTRGIEGPTYTTDVSVSTTAVATQSSSAADGPGTSTSTNAQSSAITIEQNSETADPSAYEATGSSHTSTSSQSPSGSGGTPTLTVSQSLSSTSSDAGVSTTTSPQGAQESSTEGTLVITFVVPTGNVATLSQSTDASSSGTTSTSEPSTVLSLPTSSLASATSQASASLSSPTTSPLPSATTSSVATSLTGNSSSDSVSRSDATSSLSAIPTSIGLATTSSLASSSSSSSTRSTVTSESASTTSTSLRSSSLVTSSSSVSSTFTSGFLSSSTSTSELSSISSTSSTKSSKTSNPESPSSGVASTTSTILATTLSTNTGVPKSEVPTAITTMPTATASITSDLYQINIQNAIKLNNEFAQLTSEDACFAGQVACINGRVARCDDPSRSFRLISCSDSNTRCFAMPMSNALGVKVDCFDPTTVEKILGTVPGVSSSDATTSTRLSSSQASATHVSSHTSDSFESIVTVTASLLTQTQTVIVEPTFNSAPSRSASSSHLPQGVTSGLTATLGGGSPATTRQPASDLTSTLTFEQPQPTTTTTREVHSTRTTKAKSSTTDGPSTLPPPANTDPNFVTKSTNAASFVPITDDDVITRTTITSQATTFVKVTSTPSPTNVGGVVAKPGDADSGEKTVYILVATTVTEKEVRTTTTTEIVTTTALPAGAIGF